MKFTIPLLALLLILAACQPQSNSNDVLPTAAVLPGATTNTPSGAEITAEATSESTVEETEAVVPEMNTETPVPSDTPTSTTRPMTATNTLEATQAAIGSATAAPHYVTFTAAPAGTTPVASNLNQVADVTINEQQFQEEVNARLANIPSIQSAVVDFVPGEIHVKMITSGTSPIAGTVIIPVTLVNNVASITISDITSDQQPVPDSYINVATGDLFVMMVDTLDKIVKARIGPIQKMKSIAVTDTAIEVTMLVP